MGGQEVERFLTWLAVARHVSANTCCRGTAVRIELMGYTGPYYSLYIESMHPTLARSAQAAGLSHRR